MRYQSPVFITGCARSGTSMVAGIIHKCGAWGGLMSGPNLYNRRGMFENEVIRNSIMKPYLVLNGCDPLGQNPLPDPMRLLHIENLRQRVLSVIRSQGYSGGPWFYKGAKMCLVWPEWHSAFPDARWLIVRRKDEDIVNSCLRTGFMRAFRTAEGWQSWVDEHKKRFDEMKRIGLDVHEIWPSTFVQGNTVEIQKVVEEFGLTWNQEAVMQFIEPAWWSEHKKEVACPSA